MNLEDEKKLVAEKLMGWESMEQTKVFFRDENGEGVVVKDWNPQTNRNAWDEIWDKMDGYMIIDYLQNLESELKLSNEHEHTEAIFLLHTAKPAQCWKALIKALEEQ